MINAFLLIGQSNMAGRGELGALPPIVNPDVLMFRDNEWQLAVESMATTFGDIVQRAAGRTVGLIPCAMGGTALAEWAEGEELFVQAVARTQDALAQGAILQGILWHQGEGDSGDPERANAYAERFLTMLEALQRALSAENVPVCVGEIGEFLYENPKHPYAKTVNARLRSLSECRGIECIRARGLTHKGDLLHFDAVSVREMGRRYAQAWLRLAGPMGVRLL
ncbi:MAG TPA: sialate O-acetylesterase, partial [Clostridia bacterium]|nr:sialate O-acetylesterase [Clostridia bacterium]